MNETDKWLVIVNPLAGVGKAAKDWSTIEKLLIEKEFNFETVFTEYQYHAIEIAREKITNDGFKKIVAVGGDGTLNEVVNGIFQQKRFPATEITLGMIGIGTGNDWGRMYNFPKTYKKAVNLLKKQHTFLQDIGRVKYRYDKDENHYRYFINNAGMGFDALVAKKTNILKSNGRGGTITYLYSLVTGLFQYKNTHLLINIDDKLVVDDKVFSLCIGICSYNGGGMMQLPNAIPNDGLLDITIIKKTPILTILKNIKNLYDGSFTKIKTVETYVGKKVRVTSIPPNSVYIETDGENLGNSPLDFDLIPSAINLIIRKKALMKFENLSEEK